MQLNLIHPNLKKLRIWGLLILNNTVWLFIERVTQLTKRNVQTFWTITDKVPPLQELLPA